MRSRRRKPAPEAGFSLIETLIALAIVGLTTVAIAEVFGTGLLGHRTSDDVATALSLAESQIATAGTTEPLTPHQSEGTLAGRFHWLLTISPYTDPGQKNTGLGLTASTLPIRLYRVAVAVDWREGWHQRQIALDTLRSGPPPP